MTAPETDDAFERAAQKEYRLQQYEDYKNRNVSSLAVARRTFHNRLNWFLFLGISLGAHWLVVQQYTRWLIAHAVLTVCVLLGVVAAWGHQRVADALDRERSR